MKSTKLKKIIHEYNKLSKKEKDEFAEFLYYEGGIKPKGGKKRVVFAYKVGQVKSKIKEMHMLDLTVSNEQQIEVTIVPVTATGKPAKLDGIPSWTVTSGRGTAEVAEDGLSAFLVSSDEPGDTNYLVEADADLGEGVETISDIIQLHVTGANASNLGLVAGAPVAK